MAAVRRMNDTLRQLEWKIDFFSLLKAAGVYCDSPLFTFAGESWFLRIYQKRRPRLKQRNSTTCLKPTSYISVYLRRNSPGPPINLEWSFWLKTVDGEKDYETEYTFNFKGKDQGYGSPEYLSKSELLENESELISSGILTIVCRLKYPNEDADDLAITKCSHCEKAVISEDVTSHEEKCLDKPIDCPTCNERLKLSKWFDHECQVARVKATGKLVEDFAAILKSQEHSDVIIKVKDKEFHLHRSILSGRNPYFKSMFSTDMKEKTTGIISIDDCEPNVFQSFLNFLYTGKSQKMSNDNVCALYETADKYQEDQLKVECLSFMENKISVDNFCDFLVIALRHDEKELLQSASDLFCHQTKEIILSVKWQTFMREYPTQANELYIKFLDFHASTCLVNDTKIINED